MLEEEQLNFIPVEKACSMFMYIVSKYHVSFITVW